MPMPLAPSQHIANPIGGLWHQPHQTWCQEGSSSRPLVAYGTFKEPQHRDTDDTSIIFD